MENEDTAAAAERAIETLKGRLDGRADSYEIFFSRDEGIGVEAQGGAIDALKVRSSSGVGVRTITGGRLGFGYSTVLTDEALAELASSALDASVEASVDQDLFMTGKAEAEARDIKTVDESYGEASEQEKIDLALRIEKSAMGADKRVKRVRKASYGESLVSVRVVNSNGVDVKCSSTFFSGSVTAVAEQDGKAEMGWEVGMGHDRTSVDPEAVGRGAAGNALRMLGSRRIKTIRCPAVIENVVVTELLGALAASFLGDNVEKGKSMLTGKVGGEIASPAVNITDDGLMPGGWATALYDGEGVPRRTTPLVTEGVLRGYLYDSYWGGRAGLASTGSASRAGFKGMPSVGVSNLFIEKGSKGFEGLLAEAGTGFFVTELLGVHTINSVSGDFSVGAAGLWIEDGELKYPVSGMAVSGNLLELFKRVVACGDDLRFLGSIGAPSILVSELEASGT